LHVLWRAVLDAAAMPQSSSLQPPNAPDVECDELRGPGMSLEPFYGTRAPWGGMVFVRLRPPEMSEHSAMSGMHGM